MINLQEFFDKIQEKKVTWIDDGGRMTIHLQDAIDILFEINQKEINSTTPEPKPICKKRVRVVKSSCRRWTKKEDDLLKAGVKNGLTSRELVASLENRTLSAILQRRIKLGIKAE